MRNTIAIRRALVIAIPAGIAAVLADRFIKPGLQKGLKVRP